MGKYVPAIVTGLIVTVVLAVLLNAIGMTGFTLWYLPIFLGLLTGYLMANLQGTKAGPKASDAEKAAVLALRPSPGKALIIAYRQGFVGKAAGMNITLDGQPFAQIKSPQFTAKEVDPGQHGLGFTFAGLAAAQNKPVVVGAQVSEGQVVVYRASLSMGALKNTINVERIDDLTGLAEGLRKMKMVAAG